MKIVVTGKNISINEKIQGAIDKRFEKLSKYFSEDAKVNVFIRPERDKVKMEATISVKGALFRAEDTEQDIFDCIDIVAEKLQKQMSKHKGKMQKKYRGNESVRFDMIPDSPDQDEPKVVRTKKFQLEAMTADEATLQMEMLQHDFYVYLDSATDAVNVVYKRKDGEYGLLETE
ncbi:MAG: ribosome-associated translation inhibitor RaiA [Clostridia bacterium]|nr:ribosome-associated translation inhibitor RaiA [Clostridia bacterium]